MLQQQQRVPNPPLVAQLHQLLLQRQPLQVPNPSETHYC
jgi:hypothetical protein